MKASRKGTTEFQKFFNTLAARGIKEEALKKDFLSLIGCEIEKYVKSCPYVSRSVKNTGDLNFLYNQVYRVLFKKVEKFTRVEKITHFDNDPNGTSSFDYVKKLFLSEGDLRFAIDIYYWFKCKKIKYANTIDKVFLNNQAPDKTTGEKAPFEECIESPEIVLESVAAENQQKQPIQSLGKNKKSPEYIVTYDPDTFLDPRNPVDLCFFGREQEIDLLNQFAEADKPFLFWAVIGYSGTGKTRLVYSWKSGDCGDNKKSAVKDWALLEVRSKNKSSEWWSTWEPDNNTLIVIDYVYGYEETFKAIIKRWQTLYSSGCKFKVRLILIDHIFPETVDGLRDKNWPRWGLHQIDKSDFNQYDLKQLFYSAKEGQPLRLSELSFNQEDIIRKIVTHLAGEDCAQDTIEKALDYLWMLSGGSKHR